MFYIFRQDYCSKLSLKESLLFFFKCGLGHMEFKSRGLPVLLLAYLMKTKSFTIVCKLNHPVVAK